MEESSSDTNSDDKSGSSAHNESSSIMKDESTFLDKSSMSMEQEEDLNAEVLDEIFPGIQTEILLVVTYEQVIFVDNLKRDKPILEIKLEDLLYVMGKDDTLKIGF